MQNGIRLIESLARLFSKAGIPTGGATMRIWVKFGIAFLVVFLIGPIVAGYMGFSDSQSAEGPVDEPSLGFFDRNVNIESDMEWISHFILSPNKERRNHGVRSWITCSTAATADRAVPRLHTCPNRSARPG